VTTQVERRPGETEREYAWRVYPDDAAEVLEGKDAPSGNCRQQLCHAPIWWGLTRANHRRCPFDIKPDGTRTGTSHWRTCRDRPGRARSR
jgi:hypothetical protein